MEDVRGAPGKQRIKQGAQERIGSLAPGSVRQVYITDFVVQ